MRADRSIDQALAECITHAEGDGIRLQDALLLVGPASFCFVSLLLCVPYLQPISLGPLNIASGLTFMAAGWQMTRNGNDWVLPGAMREASLKGRGWVTVLRLCEKILRLCRRITRERLTSWVDGAFGRRLTGWLIFTGGALLIMPMANLPLNNTFPALMILFAAIAWLERDGLMLLVSLAWGIVTILYFAAVGVVLWLFGSQIWSWAGNLWK